jgi:hypothetical protein
VIDDSGNSAGLRAIERVREKHLDMVDLPFDHVIRLDALQPFGDVVLGGGDDPAALTRVELRVLAVRAMMKAR